MFVQTVAKGEKLQSTCASLTSCVSYYYTVLIIHTGREIQNIHAHLKEITIMTARSVILQSKPGYASSKS